MHIEVFVLCEAAKAACAGQYSPCKQAIAIYIKDPLLVTSLYGPSDAAQAICCTKKTMLGQLFMVPSIVRIRTAKSRYSSIDPTGD